MRAFLVLVLASHMKSSPREPATRVVYRVQSFSLFLCHFMQRMRTGMVETCAVSIEHNFISVCIFITEHVVISCCIRVLLTKRKCYSYPTQES